MGNRARIQIADAPCAIYLHWNGGPESVYAFIDHARDSGRLGHDALYSTARIVEVAALFFGGNLSVGVVDPWQTSDFGEDNGWYMLDARCEVRKRYLPGPEFNRQLDAGEVERELQHARQVRQYLDIRGYLHRLDTLLTAFRKVEDSRR